MKLNNCSKRQKKEVEGKKTIRKMVKKKYSNKKIRLFLNQQVMYLLITFFFILIYT